MMGRRSAALLCVLLGHALILIFLLRLDPATEREAAELETAPITLFLDAPETGVDAIRTAVTSQATAVRIEIGRAHV